MKVPVFSSTIRRKEMDAVLSCMVSEKIGPGEINARLIQYVKETFGVDGCVAVRSPAIALKYAIKCLGLPEGSSIMISALAPSWQVPVIEDLGYKPLVLDVAEETALVTAEAVESGMKAGGSLLILHESLGNLPDFEKIIALGIPFIEDISQSAGAHIEQPAEKEGEEPVKKYAGTFGVYSILGLEERDILTAGGGAVLIAPNRREWIVLKKNIEEAPIIDLLPDINSALAWVQLKERPRNEQLRFEMKEIYARSLMQGRHKSFICPCENAVNAVYSFPVLLTNGAKDVKQYASRKEIDVTDAFEDSVAAKYEELSESCPVARSLVLRCILFPLYPRLGNSQAVKISKVLATLP
ncbi:MAG: DegT/DnrJ/EryC1/StrS family aminotransferase [Spirochaetales bacterium]|nr:DegT/DnrJ/EryC1/StrS family aminotransferase [Spirochaetales bacterium]